MSRQTAVPFEVNVYFCVSFLIWMSIILATIALLIAGGVEALDLLDRKKVALVSAVAFAVFRYAGHVRRQFGAL